MPAPNTPLPISKDTQEKVVQFASLAVSTYATSFNIRHQLLQRDLAYQRTNDYTTATQLARAANASGDTTKTQNVTIPVVMPQVETALAELHEIFLTGYPIFPTVAPPSQLDAQLQMDTIVGENSTRAAWPLHLQMAMRDGLKYDYGAVEVTWQNKKIFAVTTPANKDITQGALKETYYQGNFIKRLNPYNTITDTRVSPEENHIKGEYAGYNEILSAVALKDLLDNLPPEGTMNFKVALESPGPEGPNTTDISAPYYLPLINPDALLPVDSPAVQVNWMSWVGASLGTESNIQYRSCYLVTTLYIRLMPGLFSIHGQPKSSLQIWKFIIINNKHVVFAARQTNAHNYLPIIICKPSCDGLEWQSKSFGENATPYQQIATSLANSSLESQRRKVYDRVFYDPSRINKKDIDNVSSVARIAVKNSAYGKPISEAFAIAPYRDDGSMEAMSMSQQVAGMADIANGQNRVQQGQFQKGNKTRREFDVTMAGANTRGRMRALAIEYSFFVPIKEIIKSNILQYQPPTSLVNMQSNDPVQVDPAVLRQANISFRMSDGYLPTEKMASGDLLDQFVQLALTIPAVQAEYDVMGMLTYSMALKGASWIKDFKRTPEQMQQYMQTMGQASAATQPGPAAPAVASSNTGAQ